MTTAKELYLINLIHHDQTWYEKTIAIWNYSHSDLFWSDRSLTGEKAFRFIHTADTHLGIGQPKRKVRENAWYRSHDFQNNFLLVLKEAMKPEINFLIHAGDVYDRSKPPIPVVKETQEQLFQLALHKPVFLLPGNHERSTLKESLLNSFSQVRIFNRPKTFEYEINGLSIAVTGVPFVRHGFAKHFPELLKKTGHDKKRYDYKILVMHQLLEGATVGIQDFTFRITDPNVLPLSKVPGSFNYIALGHVHRYQRLFPRHLDVPVVYPGSIERTALAEINEVKGFVHVEITGEKDQSPFKTTVKFIELPTRPMHHLKIDTGGKAVEMILLEIESMLQSLGRDSIVHLRVTSSDSTEFWSLLKKQEKSWAERYRLRQFTVRIIDKAGNAGRN